MTGETKNRDIAAMTADFVLRASQNEFVAGICRELIEEEAHGSVCIRLQNTETTVKIEDSASRTPWLISIAPEDSGLFVFDREKKLFYTRRNWRYETAVRDRINSMAGVKCDDEIEVPEDGVFKGLNELQREAVKQMNSHQFTILTGGPGTGKTYTIARAVKLIRDRHPNFRLGLAAPTGKAAARVNESMQKESEKLALDSIPQATTLHSLLKPNYDLVTFKHDQASPLPLDWLIVDEASMVSLPLMAKLLDALPPDCRLTLVGDANQLSSVEPGRVFGDLCGMKAVENNHCKCELRESKRFPPDGEIAKLADAINRGDGKKVLEILHDRNNRTVHYRSLDNLNFKEFFGNSVENEKGEGMFADFSRQNSPEGALGALNDCRILCAVRKGIFGCERLNELVLAKLVKMHGGCPIPVMITRNDQTLGVSNGDVGVILPNPGGGTAQDGDKLFLMQGDQLRKIPLSLLADHEMAFATTVHKAQGSEFENVILVLPPYEEGRNSGADELPTRELLYTALTRIGRGEIFIYAADDAIMRCCARKSERSTGLQES